MQISMTTRMGYKKEEFNVRHYFVKKLKKNLSKSTAITKNEKLISN